MIERLHNEGERQSRAVYSDCDTYRYLLARHWSGGPEAAARLLFVMLNPSTANEIDNDPTIARCESRARELGFDGYTVVNLFAYRALRPRQLRAAVAPVGPGNDTVLREAAAAAEMILCAWGDDGRFLDRDRVVEGLLRGSGVPLWHLGLTRKGRPRHPLYLRQDRSPERWD